MMSQQEERYLQAVLASIAPLDAAAMERCQLRLDNLTKPLGSLHHLEHLALKMAGASGQARPPLDLQRSLLVLAADHGLAAAAPAWAGETTGRRLAAACREHSPLRLFARHSGAALTVVDVGLREPVPLPGLRQERIAPGTADLRQGPAMSRRQALAAVCAGLRLAAKEAARGVRLLGVGDIAQGGLASAVALVAAWHGEVPRGLRTAASAGGDGAQLLAAVEAGLARHPRAGRGDAWELLCCLGGLETAALCGVMLGAAAAGMVVVLDGVATAAAALVAAQLQPLVKDYLVAPHAAAEPGLEEALALLGLPAYLRLDLHQGEGLGAALGLSLLRSSLHILNDMKTFGEAAVPVAQDGPGALRQSLAVKD